MFIPNPNFSHPGSRIPDPGSKRFRIPDTGSASKNLSNFNPKNCFQALEKMIRDVHPGSESRILVFYPSRIPDPWIKKAKDPGSGSATKGKGRCLSVSLLQWSVHWGEGVGRTVTITLIREGGWGWGVPASLVKSFWFRLLKGAPPGRKQVNYYTGELAQLAISQVVYKYRVITGQKKKHGVKY